MSPATYGYGWTFEDPVTPMSLADPAHSHCDWADRILDVRTGVAGTEHPLPADLPEALPGRSWRPTKGSVRAAERRAARGATPRLDEFGEMSAPAVMAMEHAGWRVETRLVPRFPGDLKRRCDTYVVITAPDGLRLGVVATSPPSKTGPKVAWEMLSDWFGYGWWNEHEMDVARVRAAATGERQRWADRFEDGSLSCLFDALRVPERWWGSPQTASAHATVRGWRFLFQWATRGIASWTDIEDWFPYPPAAHDDEAMRHLHASQIPEPGWMREALRYADTAGADWDASTVQHWLTVYGRTPDSGGLPRGFLLSQWLDMGLSAQEAAQWDALWRRMAAGDYRCAQPGVCATATRRYVAAQWSPDQVWEALRLLAHQTDTAYEHAVGSGAPDTRTGVSHPAEHRDALEAWVEQMSGEDAVTLLAQETTLAQWRAEQHLAQLAAAHRCVFPLDTIGARWSGRVRWSPPSSPYNEDGHWYLPAADYETDAPSESVAFWNSEDDFGLDYGGTPTPDPCGAQADGMTGLCAIHAGLPYTNMTPPGWDHVRTAIDYRLRARREAEAAWLATRTP